ncbi:unnamed protein product [Mesocestoides corti]|uniref:H/ACA ribonucleoprotein complex non-core subunit NAF1 n=2 Tax=Mesocestoides corti TaxID=53468 RepID=A0A0R3ULF2_MESCO|nr:unnamed protein product [Mesocestoides corti]
MITRSLDCRNITWSYLVFETEELPDSLVEASLALSSPNLTNAFIDVGDAYFQKIINDFSTSPLDITSIQNSVTEVLDFMPGVECGDKPPILSEMGAVDLDYNCVESDLLGHQQNNSKSKPVADVTSCRLGQGHRNIPISESLMNKQKQYRQPKEVISEDESDSLTESSDADDADGDFVDEASLKKPTPRKSEALLDVDPSYVPRLPGPPPANCKLEPLGKVSSFISGCVIIEAMPSLPALDTGSALYLTGRRPLGEVYDTIGPVRSPFYVVVHENRQPPPSLAKKPSKPRNRPRNHKGRQNATLETAPATQALGNENSLAENAREEEASAQALPTERVKLKVKVNLGDRVYYVADDPALSIPILCSELARLRGSDASGQHDRELPVELQEYSDDEEERLHKRKLKSKRSAPGADLDGSSGARGGHHLRRLTTAGGGFAGRGGKKSGAWRPSNSEQLLRPSFLPDASRQPPASSAGSTWDPRAPPTWSSWQSYNQSWGPPTEAYSAAYSHQSASQAYAGTGRNSIFSPAPLPPFGTGPPAPPPSAPNQCWASTPPTYWNQSPTPPPWWNALPRPPPPPPPPHGPQWDQR